MTPDEFARLKALYVEAVDLPDGEQRRLLDRHLDGEPDLRAELERWLGFDGGDTGSGDPGVLTLGVALAGEAPPPIPPVLGPGDRLAGRYRIDAFIDRGGMGEVYRAIDEDLGAPIAVKTIRPVVGSRPETLRRLKREVLLARSVTHPNVCRIFDIGRDPERGLSFLTMELLDGETLDHRLRTRGRIEPDPLRARFRELAGALDAAHAAGIVHRDVKAANIMLVPAPGGERAVITDFGLALPRASAPDPGDEDASAWDPADDGKTPTAGTPAYMSPEQVRGEALAPPSDLYSLGVVLYEAITGHRPFDGPTPIAVARARLTTAPRPPGELVPVDTRWERVILRLLDPDPGSRYPTAGDAVRALDGRAPAVPPRRFVLPAEADPFVGRSTELEEIDAHLAVEAPEPAAGPLTLIGPAGVGKTRLAIHYARMRLSGFAGGAWWCDLGGARSEHDVVTAVARTLGVTLGASAPPDELGRAIHGLGRCLVILDNVEQILGPVGALLATWRDAADDARFLLTSQERLRIPSESVLDVPPLDPDLDAVELFAERARAARPEFRLDETTRPLVEEITRTLDGLPLAVELAASRLRMLDLSQLRDRIRDRFRILVGGRRGRHETLQAALDWSWELLSPTERSVMAQLSVFEGGFGLEAAEAVVRLPGTGDATSVLDVLQSLVDRSWLRARVVGGDARFVTYATIQAYATEALGRVPSGEAGFGVRDTMRRHAAYHASLDRPETMRELNRSEGVDRLSREMGNVVAACRRAIAAGDASVATHCFAIAMATYRRIGPTDAAVSLAREMLEAPGVEGSDLARVNRYLGIAELQAGRLEEARAAGEAALASYRELGDVREAAKVATDLGDVMWLLGEQAKAVELRREALDAYRELGDRDGEGYALCGLAFSEWRAGRTDDALRSFDDAITALREVGNQRMEGYARFGLGAVHYHLGHHRAARAHYEAAIELSRAAGDPGRMPSLLCSLGTTYFLTGSVDAARRALEGSLALQRESGDRMGRGHSLTALGWLHATQGNLDDAEGYLAEALTTVRAIKNRAGEGLVLGYQGLVHRLRGNPGEARRHFEDALAHHRDVGPPSQEAYLLAAIGGLDLAEGRLADARARHEEALDACARAGWKVGEAPIRIGLAEVDCVDGRIEDGVARAERGLRHLEGPDGSPHQLGIALAVRGRLHLAAWDRASATAACDRASRLAEELGVTSRSELASAVARLRDDLATR